MSVTDPTRVDGPAGETPDVIYLLDARGHRRSPAARPGYRPTRPPATKGRTYDPDPLPVEDVVKVLNACVALRPGTVGEMSARRLRAMVVVLWRTGVRMMELLDLEERDLNRREKAIVVRRGKGGKRRLVIMDDWGWDQLDQWLPARATLPPGKLFCVLSGPTAGGQLKHSDARRQLREVGLRAGVRRRVHAHAFRHTCAADMRREHFDLLQIQHQLGHAHLGVTQVYMRGIAPDEILDPIRDRKPPMMIVPTA